MVPKGPSCSDASGPVLVKDVVTEPEGLKDKELGGWTKANSTGHMMPQLLTPRGS